MKNQGFALKLLCVFAAGAVSAELERTEGNPIGQVLNLLNDLQSKIKADGAAEEAAYKEYFRYCDDVTTQKQFEIKQQTKHKDKLTSKIEELTSDMEKADTKIGDLAKDISANTADLEAATKMRNSEKADFKANEDELLSVIDTLGKAVTILQHEMSKKPALMQVAEKGLKGVVQALTVIVDSAAFAAHDKDKLLALVQSQTASTEESDSEQPQEAYKSKSGGIFTVLQELAEQAEAQLSELRRAEMKTVQNYKELKQSLDNEIAAANADMEEIKKEKAGAAEAKATAEGDLGVTVADLKQTHEALKLAQTECMQVAAEHEASVRSRATELKTLGEATETIQEMTGAAQKQTYSFLQEGAAVTLDLSHSSVITMVKELANTIGGADLAQLSSRISAVAKLADFSGEDPFVKVKELIRELITKLQKEADDLVSEKAYCDHEMAKTGAKKSELDDDIAELTAKIDSALARSAELKQDVQDIQEDLVALAHENGEAKKLRQAEHADYVKAKADLEQGLSGVRRALVILREYYAADDDASLLQESTQDVESFEARMKQPSKPSGHSSSKGAGGGIIGVLQVAESDFANNLAKLEMEESTAQEAHDKTLQENQITKTAKEQDVKYKTQEFTALDKDISELVSDKDSQQTELTAVLEYDAKLKERCIKKPEPYEEVKKRREAEIAGLKEALSALASEASLQQVKSGAGKKRGQSANMRGTLQPGN